MQDVVFRAIEDFFFLTDLGLYKKLCTSVVQKCKGQIQMKHVCTYWIYVHTYNLKSIINASILTINFY